jgi:hypothetical protein
MRPAIVPTETNCVGCGKIRYPTPVWCIDGNPFKEVMVGDEREKRMTEEPDVEGHMQMHHKHLNPDGTPADDDGDDDDTPDVEAHHHKV